MPDVMTNVWHCVRENPFLQSQSLQSKKILLIDVSLHHGHNRFISTVVRKLAVDFQKNVKKITIRQKICFLIKFLIFEKKKKKRKKTEKYLDCHGVITPSSGPPISTSFLSRVKLVLNLVVLAD